VQPAVPPPRRQNHPQADPIEANSIEYWIRAAAGVFTVTTEQANPAMRRPNTAKIDPPIEKLPRLLRVCAECRKRKRQESRRANG